MRLLVTAAGNNNGAACFRQEWSLPPEVGSRVRCVREAW